MFSSNVKTISQGMFPSFSYVKRVSEDNEILLNVLWGRGVVKKKLNLTILNLYISAYPARFNEDNEMF